jgi:hypothetical protein
MEVSVGEVRGVVSKCDGDGWIFFLNAQNRS